jgi:thioredoxin reductase (NADPH)
MTSPETHDLVVIGAGPAGLTAALTAESQHIDTLILDDNGVLGGQAATATLIENYPGFPEGVNGKELMDKIVAQALKFTTEFVAPARVDEVAKIDEGILVTTDEKEEFLGRAALLSIGVEPRRLKARNLAAFLGRGVTYSSPLNSTVYQGKNLFIVGGSDSAAQAAVCLARFEDCNVHMLVRGQKLEGKVSGHLIDKVADRKNIQVHTQAELVSVDGQDHLEELIFSEGGDMREVSADEVFVLIGSTPKTSWLPQEVETDNRGFVKSGNDISLESIEQFKEQAAGRQPFPHETSMPGLFVAGDVRHGTDKWVTLAILDGASVVPELHRARIHNNLYAKIDKY